MQSEKAREHRREYCRKYYQEHRTSRLEYHRKHWARTAEDQRGRRLFTKYGLTPEAFGSMMSGQGGVCTACGSDAWGPGGPQVDHDHATGKVRGILCFGCNTAAGLLRDSAERARALASYLRRP